jgi:class 3 adenylate cyclase/tetratricopeptide (TPR) repeat protein
VSDPIFSVPEGPVTIMFTDIEGSTALRTSLGDDQADKLFHEHDELVRELIAEHRGHDQKAALGDGFLAVFQSTRRALACAVGVQRALDSVNRMRSGPAMRVRIGLNTGEVAWQDGQLSGEAVHAASRVCAAASGGQILVSDVTRQLAGTVPDVSFLDAGEHDLKGFPQPWRLWEIIWVRETAQVSEQVFVGRESELAFLRSRLNAALDGRGSTILVGGEPGVGKTTLVRQLIREAEQRGALAVFGRCYESEGTVPYSPFVEMLEAGLAVMPAEIVREDLGDDAPEVARMVPELRRRFPDIPEPLDIPPEQQRRYFFNAVGAFIGRAAARFPLLLVMDDVHWADEPSLLLIEYMANLVPDMRVLAVGTYRDVELDVSRPLAATLEHMVRNRTVERLPVKRFDRDRVAEMIGALAGREPPRTIVDAIFEETEGNPFFVEEVFRHLVEEGKVFDESGSFRTDLHVDELDVPESVRLVVGRRLERLGAEAQRALAAGAVVGRGFPFSLLEAITELDAGRLLDVVDEAEAARVIVPEERDGEVHFTFAHELIRQTLLAGLSLLRRQRLHLSVANALERIDPQARTNRPSEIANHLLLAGAAAETERTLEYLQRAADRAMQAAAFEEALRSSEAALTIIDPSDTQRAAELEERLGFAHRALGDFEKCLEIFSRVVDTYRDLGEAERAADLCREMAYQYLWLGRFDDVLSANQRGLDILGDRRVASRAYHVAGIGALLGVGGFLDAARDHISQGDEIAREIGDDRALGWVNWTRCVAAYSSNLLDETIEAGEKATEQLRRAGDLWTMCDSLSWTALALVLSGSTEKAQHVSKEAFDLSRRLGHVGGEILSHRALLASEQVRNIDLERWEQGVRRDIELCESINSPWVSQGHAWLGSVTQMRGRTDEALGHLERAVELEPQSAYSGLGRAYVLLNRAYARDEDAFRSAVDDARPGLPGGTEAMPWGSRVLALNVAQGSAFLGLADLAADIHEHVVGLMESLPLGFFDGALSRRVAGMTATLLGAWDEAEQHFAFARRLAAEFPSTIEPQQVEHWHGKMLLARGKPEDRDRGRAMVGGALEWYRGIGMPLHAAMAEELLTG